MGRCLAHQIGFSLLVTILVCLWIAPRRSLCSDYWDVTPNYCNGTRYDFSDDEIEAIVNVHNEIRAAVGATNMLKLEWDEDLAEIASNYSQKCIFNNNPERHDLSTMFTYVGENVAAIVGVNNERTLLQDFVASVRRWYEDDAPFYLYDYHYCNPLARCKCRFYLQMVWAETCSIGCGVALCPLVRYYSAPDVYLLVCNYGPGRDLIKYMDDPPYEVGGDSCDDCPAGYDLCYNDLCDSNTTVCGMAGDDQEDSDSSSSESSSESSESNDSSQSGSSQSGSSQSSGSQGDSESSESSQSGSTQSASSQSSGTQSASSQSSGSQDGSQRSGSSQDSGSQGHGDGSNGDSSGSTQSVSSGTQSASSQSSGSQDGSQRSGSSQDNGSQGHGDGSNGDSSGSTQSVSSGTQSASSQSSGSQDGSQRSGSSQDSGSQDHGDGSNGDSSGSS